MYEFYYHYMKSNYGKNLPLCYMETDSLVCDIKTANFYEDINSNVEARFDMSRYGCSCPLPMRVNKRVIGLIKDELCGRIRTKFVALRPKLYTCNMLSGSGDQKCKGVKKCIVKKMLDFEDYKHCLLPSWNTFQKQPIFWSRKYEVHTIEVSS